MNDDLISRDAVLDACSQSINILDAMSRIEDLPSVTQRSETVTEFADKCRECGAKYGKLLKQEPCDDAISRHAVIELVEGWWLGHTKEDDLSTEIKQLPSVNPKPCEDAISRDAAIRATTGMMRDVGIGDEIGKEYAEHILSCLPSVTPKQRTGHWEWLPYDYNPKLGDWRCSECRSVVIECVKKDEKGGIPLYKYCPQCGRKMQEVEDGRDSSESEEQA